MFVIGAPLEPHHFQADNRRACSIYILKKEKRSLLLNVQKNSMLCGQHWPL